MSSTTGWFVRPDTATPAIAEPDADAEQTAFDALDLPAHVQEFLAQKAAAGV